MAAMTTERLVAIAYEIAGWSDEPPDWMVYQPGTRISHILFGLEIGPADLFMARQLGYHAVVCVEPAGYSGPAGPRMSRHVSRLVAAGLSREDAVAASSATAREQRAADQSRNYDHAPSVARLLEMPFLTVFDPLAEVGRATLQARIDEHLAGTQAPALADVRDAVMTLPSFAQARTAPQLMPGEWTDPAGRTLALDYGWGLVSTDEVRAYFDHGVQTLCIPDAPSQETITQAREQGRAILSLGRSATESVGALPYAQRLRDEGIEVTTFAGILGD